MSAAAVGVAGLAAMLVLMALGVPIGYAMLIVGALGNTLVSGLGQTAAQLASVFWEGGTNFTLVALPLFVLMGQLAFHARIAADLYDCVYKWFGALPGGLAVTGCVTAAAFGAVTGSSFATVHTMGTMAIPEMRRYGYDLKLATGSVAAAGTLAILIPPSVVMVLYGVFTETSIARLFVAGIVPGLLLTASFAATIVVRCRRRPALGPPGPRVAWAPRLRSLARLAPTLAVFLLVLGGIYGGAFSPDEAAGIGAAGMLVVALAMGRLDRRVLRDALVESAAVSGVLFTILAGGLMMSRFLVQTGLTERLVEGLVGLELGRVGVLVLLAALYLALGCVLDVLGMMVLTLPFVFPLVKAMGIDPVWFGVFVTVMAEIALITPPVGLNVYIMQTVVPDVPAATIFAGVWPFVAVCLALVALLIAVPEVALWLPRRM